MEDAVNPYQPPDAEFAATPPQPGAGPIVLTGPYDSEELDYESPEVQNSVISSAAAVVTLLLLATAPFSQPLLYVVPVSALVWVVALWVERSEQRIDEARFRDQRLDLMEQIAVDEAGVAVTIEGETSVADWTRLAHVVEEPQRLILSGESWFWLPLPRGRLANEGDWERLVELVRSRLPAPPTETPALADQSGAGTA